MDDNVVLVGFTDQSRAYQALSRLGQADDTGMVEVRSAALLERGPDGVVRVPEGADTASGLAVAGGGLIGLLVGVLGGPLGMLLGTSTGMLVGGVAAADRADDQDVALAAISGQIQTGHTVLVAEVGEDTPRRHRQRSSRTGRHRHPAFRRRRLRRDPVREGRSGSGRPRGPQGAARPAARRAQGQVGAVQEQGQVVAELTPSRRGA